MLRVVIERLRLPSLPNTRMYWRALAALTGKQKKRVARAMKGAEIPPAPLIVTITRSGPRKLDDDNLQGACKYVRDQIAREVGVDDGSDIYTWIYKQVIGSYAVTVEIMSRDISSG